MELFTAMERDDYEELLFCQDKASGLKAIIAIHDTTLGPALGGTRMWTYATEEAAVTDALRLAKGMTYKNAAAGLNLGGGKTVIIGDPKKTRMRRCSAPLADTYKDSTGVILQLRMSERLKRIWILFIRRRTL